jgi:hypothetical protein
MIIAFSPFLHFSIAAACGAAGAYFSGFWALP